MRGATPLRSSSFVVVALLAVGAGSGSLGVFACSSFDETPGAGGDGGGPDAESTETTTADATADAATEAAADAGGGCPSLASDDLLDGGWTLGGTAVLVGNFVVMLTKATDSQGGIAWHPVDLAMNQSFRATFTLRVTTTDVAPADGVTFFWSGDKPPLLGKNGDKLGFCDDLDGGGVNGGAVALGTTLVPSSVSGAPVSNVSLKHNEPGKCIDDGPVTTTAPLSDSDAGTIASVIEISLDGPAHTITVRRDSKTVINRQPLQYLPGPIRSIGFTAATGNNYAAHEITDLTLTSCP